MLEIDGSQLTIENVIEVAQQSEKVTLAAEATQRIRSSQKWVEDIVAQGDPVYGVNTGFGIFSNKKISPEDTIKLNRNLILSHAVGLGPELPDEVVRAAMLIRANTLAGGYSGVRPLVVETLLELLNKELTPSIPSQGSLGSSGDLAPLSHLALVFTTDKDGRETDSGWAAFNGQRMTGKDAMHAANIERLILGPKEGLAITNGATFSAALAALAVNAGSNLLFTAEIALAMSLEALLGASAAFDPRLHAARRQEGQKTVAENVRKLTQGSTLLDAAGRVQDAYSLRCAPQVQGPARDILEYVEQIVSREINAATDNPLLFAPNEAISGGNFHGEPIGMAMDFLKIAFSELAAISERRIYHLTDEKMNAGLPAMLVDDAQAAGVNSGVMMLQYTAASLVLENQGLSTPNSVHSLPTSGGKEDHNANAMTAARNTSTIIENTSHILAIELYTAARALDLRLRERPDARMGVGVREAHKKIRKKIPYQSGDVLWGPEIERAKELVTSGELSRALQKS
ncbi:MAG: histidine ammonia-lyase [Chloroflexi bacterium]|nr:histidine ammonia-lyase [Chloroflexota bacterium]